MPSPPTIPAERIVVIMPNWLGDAVMATPFLRALRDLYPRAHIAALARPLVAPVLAGLPSVNETRVSNKEDHKSDRGWLRDQRFDLGILLPNSFRSAWLLWRAGVKRRLGYAREARALLLTDNLTPVKRSATQREADRAKAQAIREIAKCGPAKESARLATGSTYQPVPTIDYYLKLAAHLGAGIGADKRMQLGITGQERTAAESVLHQIDNRQSTIENLVVLVPGANFGASKCWMPERFAEVADRLVEQRGATVIIASAPAELPIVDAILSAAKHRDRLFALAKFNGGNGAPLGALKEIVRRSKLMVCNDTGPRHFAAAFGVPTVTLFGPTDPVWAQTYSPNERIVRINVPCGPCQLKTCPIDHRCMTGLTVEMVMKVIDELWNADLTTPRLDDLTT